VPRFCRHNRFIERCPICRETVPGLQSPERRGLPAIRAGKGGAGTARTRKQTRTGRGRDVRVYREGSLRGEDDGYRNELVAGLHGSQDAERLAGEIAFASARLQALEIAPPGLYGEIRAQAQRGEGEDEEQATWMAFLTAYLSPLQAEDPFAGIRQALHSDWRGGELPELEDVPLGPRTSHERSRGAGTLRAYVQWFERAGSQGAAFRGDDSWSPVRRFERLFERLTLPGFGRMGRYDLLVTLGRLGMYELRADSLHLAGIGAATTSSDPTTLAAKRAFGIGDPLILDRRALALAQALSVPVEALDLALANWGAQERASMGMAVDAGDEQALARARAVLEL
jgi:hypothetical protein